MIDHFPRLLGLIAILAVVLSQANDLAHLGLFFSGMCAMYCLTLNGRDL